MTRCISFCLVHLLAFVLLSSALPHRALGQASVQGQWSTLANSMPINPVHAALLSNGKVLVVAGSGNCPPSQSGCPSGPPYGPSNGSGALLLDPVSGQTISQFSVSWDMFCNGMVLLEDGRPFIASGTIQYDPFFGQQQTATFDSQANTFSNGPNMAHGRWYPTLVTLGDGRVMIFSGLNETGSTNTAVEFYSIDTGWSSQYTASWTPDLYPRMHLLPNGKVLYSGAQTTSKLFDTSTDTWNTSLAKTNYSGTRTYGSSVLLPLSPSNNYDPKVIIMGGGNPATATTEIIDMGSTTPAWKYGPNMSQARIEMNAVILPNGKVLALGGSVNDEDTSTASLNADLYDPASNTFSSAGANAYPRLYHSVALLLPDATVWFAGGNPSRGSYMKQMEIYKPAYLFNSDGTQATRPSITSAPSSVSYGESFTVTTPDTNIASVVLVRNGTVTHAFGMDQREVGLSFTAASGSLTVTAPPNGNIAPPGYYMLFLLNQSGVPSIASFLQITAAPATPDFSVTATPSSQNVAQGNSTSYTVNVTPSNGFTGNVSFSVAGLPSGATASFTPTSVSGSGSSTLAVNASTSTPAGTYPLTITATSGSLTHPAQVNLTVVVPDFSVTATPSSQNTAPGKSTSYTVNLTSSGGFTGNVSFSVAGLPSGATASFTPTSVSGSGSSALTVNASSSTPSGTYPLTITATSGTLTHTAPVTLTVADFSISVSPSSQTLTAAGNSKATYTVTISALGPFSATTTFSVSGLPARTSASFSPVSVPGKGTSTLTISARGKAPSGTSTLTVSATGGGLTHSATVSLVIQ
jgi:uncharacterized membrane protein